MIGWQDLPGMFSEEDCEFVQNICRNIYNGSVVELGSYCGRSMAAMCTELRGHNVNFFCVDNFSGGDPTDVATKQQQKESTRSALETNIKKMGFDFVRIIESDSADAALIFEDETIDFCFIDADHREESVRKDINAWWPKIVQGGWIGGHDYYDLGPTVKVPVDEFILQNGLTLVRGGTCWAAKKAS